MQRPIRVCHVIFRLDVGGLENGLVNLINHLPRDRFHHAIICLTEATDFARRIRSPEVPVFSVHKRAGKDIAAYFRVWRLIRKLRPDIVHSRNLPALDMLAPAALARVRRIVYSEHGFDMLELQGRHGRYNRLRRLSRLVVNRYVAVSRELSGWLETEIGIPEGKISLIYNGVDAEAFAPASRRPDLMPNGFLAENSFVIGTVGRLEPVKDQVTLARAFVGLLEHRPELRHVARLVILGDGSLRQEIADILRNAQSLDLAWLPGFTDQPAEFYRTFSVFVLPSQREGISNTALEAMSSGLSVIATRVGGNPEIVLDGLTGQLVPPADPGSMRDALIRYIDDSELAARHGRAGRARAVEHFSLERMVRCYGDLYASL